MTYVFPPSLYPLRNYLRGRGADTLAFATARQAAFMAQQLLGTRVKFPDKGADMMSTLLSIQTHIGETEKAGRGMASTPACARSAAKRSGRDRHTPKYAKINSVPEISSGYHIFCDGAAVPNPGTGGWGVALYLDGVEVDNAYGGDPEATNNQMELTGILNAIVKAKSLTGPVIIWCDSQYCVKGVNEWSAGWKAKGWQRGGDNAEPKNRILLNAELWQAIDEQLTGIDRIKVRWVKGHCGIAGNERADQLAEKGRKQVQKMHEFDTDLLASEYRAIMAGER